MAALIPAVLTLTAEVWAESCPPGTAACQLVPHLYFQAQPVTSLRHMQVELIAQCLNLISVQVFGA